MPSPSELTVGVGLIVGLLLVPLDAQGAERSVSDIVLVDTGAVVADDLYAAGNRVVVQGRVDGDLVASAFEDILITGEVTGDVMGVAASVVVSGRVGGAVRVVTPDLVLDGEVAGDVVVLAWDTLLGGSLGGDAVVWSRHADLTGSIGGDLEGQMDTLVLGGNVEGFVDVTVDRLAAEDGAVVGGDLAYRSASRSPEIEGVEVGGVVVARRPLEPNIRLRALLIFSKLVSGLGAAVVGLLVMWAAPAQARRATETIRRSWPAAWGRGVVVCAAPLLIVVVAGVMIALASAETALPVVAVLVPVFLAVVGLVAALALAGPAASYPWLGDRRGVRTPLKAFLSTTAVVTLGLLVPWVGWLVAGFVVPLGIGGWVGPRPEVAHDAAA